MSARRVPPITSKDPLHLSADLLKLFEEMPNLQELFENMLEKAPAFVDRRTAAELITGNLFPVSHRSLDTWPLPTRYVNGRAVMPTFKLLEMAFGKLAAGPVVMGGRKTEDRQAA